MARQNLTLAHVTDPTQLTTNANFEEILKESLLRGKTIQQYAPVGTGQTPFQAEDNLLRQLQSQGKISVKISAYLLDPHELRVQQTAPTTAPTPPLGPTPAAGTTLPVTMPGQSGDSAPAPNGPLQIGNNGVTVP